MTPRQQIEVIWDLGGRFALSLKGGNYFEGYILELEDDDFSFGLVGPMAPDQPIRIRYEDVDMQRWAYYCCTDKIWKAAAWNEGEQRWVITPVHPSRISVWRGLWRRLWRGFR